MKKIGQPKGESSAHLCAIAVRVGNRARVAYVKEEKKMHAKK